MLSQYRFKLLALYATLLGAGAGTYFLESPRLRAAMVLGLVAAVVWATSSTPVNRTAVQDSTHSQERRFLKLRHHVDQLLSDIRRLNWIALDARMGFKDPEATRREMDRATQDMMISIGKIRETAGVDAATINPTLTPNPPPTGVSSPAGP